MINSIHACSIKAKIADSMELIIRVLCLFNKIIISLFLKNDKNFRETRYFLLLLTIFLFGNKKFINLKNSSREEIETSKSREILFSHLYNTVIPDEIIIAMNFGPIAEDKIIEFIKNGLAEVKIILTERNAYSEMMKRANFITEIKEIKHSLRKMIFIPEVIEF